MRQDQYERLQTLTEKLTDVFLEEANPETWPGHGIAAGQMDQQTRGDRYWVKKNAAATLTVIMKTSSLIGVIQQRSAAGAPDGVQPETEEPDGLDGEIRAAEKEAARLLNKLGTASSKEAFDKRVHGK
ncbi:MULTISPECIES: hypothetical protein [unclassified Cupriavidus]|uniref:hypothetical protein n=1 Tax=unclassified Cupriavidus TaxID=2640874 RepID=UPI001BFFE86A|nr:MULTISPECIES: hypothetical protein [unclassified Cupriavidus]MCA3182750.1 hypothetical protein [Cupriavidus sp.]MCA3189812.1 hypothetical protein [Cupriavidus sp.]MCA3196406.1 hypothetical protein [Cupriavidus sp.]MCA3202151.1 hypothetical protein [Cupriavidus sp.]MCA3232193.1 hypothetical protein [Cupriavidus sp.]